MTSLFGVLLRFSVNVWIIYSRSDFKIHLVGFNLYAALMK